MKKLLALVLALVMVLGLATVSTSAAYTDDADISYDEAVAVMTAVGVFQGKGDSFAPKDGLNRAEAAKLIAYLMLGNKTAESMKGTGAKFADVPASHWASGYIEYLATAGVISGVGGGNFDPNGKITAVAFAKMLLVALGYDAQIEGFQGDSSWAINIQKLANDNDLYDLLDDLNSTDALTREQAAQMCLNDLKADMVEYESKGTTVEVSGAKVTTDAKKATVQVTTNDKGKAIDDLTAIGISKAGYVLQLGEELYNGDLKLTKSDEDDMGRPCDKWTYKTNDVGTYAAKSDLLLSATKKVEKKAVYSAIGKDAYNDLKDGYTNKAVYRVYLDGKEVTGDTGYTLADLVEKDSTGASAGSANGKLFELYLTEDYNDDADLYTFVVAQTYLVQATADYSSSTEKLKISWIADEGDNYASKPDRTALQNEISQDDFNVADVKEDDYLVVTYSASDNSFQSVAKATALTGEVTSYKKDKNIVIDGTTYEYNSTVGKNASHGYGVEPEISSQVKVILDPYGYIIYVDDLDVSSTYLFVDVASNNNLDAKAEVYFLDGTTKTVTVKKITDNTGASHTKASAVGTALNTIGGAWYTYTVDSNGAYTLKYVDATTVKNTEYTQANTTITDDPLDTTNATYVLYSDKVAGFIGGQAALKANNDTIVVVMDDDEDLTVYSGVSKLPDITIDQGETENVKLYWTVKDNFVKYLFVDASDVSIDIDGGASNEYAFVVHNGKTGSSNTSSEYRVAGDNQYYEVDLYYNANKELVKKVKVDADAIGDFDEGVMIKKIRTDSKTDYLDSAKKITLAKKDDDELVLTNQSALGYSDGTITLGSNTYSLKNNRVVLIIDKNDNTLDKIDNTGADYQLDVVTGSGLKSALSGFTYTYDAYGVLADDNSFVIEDLYIRVKTAVKTGATDNTYALTLTVGDGIDSVAVKVGNADARTYTASSTIYVANGAKVVVTPTKTTSTDTLYINGTARASYTIASMDSAQAVTVRASGNPVVYLKGTANTTTQVGEITNVRIANGQLTATLSLDVPAWVVPAGEATLSGTMKVDGANVTIGNSNVFMTTNNKALNALNAASTLTPGAKWAVRLTSDNSTNFDGYFTDENIDVEFGDLYVAFGKVAVRVFDDYKDSTTALSAANLTKYFGSDITTGGLVVGTNKTLDLDMGTAGIGSVAGVTGNVKLVDVSGATIVKDTGTSDLVKNGTFVVTANDSSAQVGLTVLGTDYVDVHISTEEVAVPYAIKFAVASDTGVVTETAADGTLQSLGKISGINLVTGTYAATVDTDITTGVKAYTLSLKSSKAAVVSNADNKTTTITAAIQTEINYAETPIKVTVGNNAGLDDLVFIFANDNSTTAGYNVSGSSTAGYTVTIGEDTVFYVKKVEVMDSPYVTSVYFEDTNNDGVLSDNDNIVVTFNTAMDDNALTSGNALSDAGTSAAFAANVTWAADGKSFSAKYTTIRSATGNVVINCDAGFLKDAVYGIGANKGADLTITAVNSAIKGTDPIDGTRVIYTAPAA